MSEVVSFQLSVISSEKKKIEEGTIPTRSGQVVSRPYETKRNHEWAS